MSEDCCTIERALAWGLRIRAGTGNQELELELALELQNTGMDRWTTKDLG